MKNKILAHKKALLLDMNGTFMFGEDRFGEGEDYSIQYCKVGGVYLKHEINEIIRVAYDFLKDDEVFLYLIESNFGKWNVLGRLSEYLCLHSIVKHVFLTNNRLLEGPLIRISPCSNEFFDLLFGL